MLCDAIRWYSSKGYWLRCMTVSSLGGMNQAAVPQEATKPWQTMNKKMPGLCQQCF